MQTSGSIVEYPSTISTASTGQILSQSQQPVHLVLSMRYLAPASAIAARARRISGRMILRRGI